MIKKSRKQFVPDELKDDKYWARRRKNNIAAKRSRDARRQKENQIAMRARYLEKEVSVSVLTQRSARAHRSYVYWPPDVWFFFLGIYINTQIFHIWLHDALYTHREREREIEICFHYILIPSLVCGTTNF